MKSDNIIIPFLFLYITLSNISANDDYCSKSVKLLDAKMNKILYILESHFNTNFDNLNNGVYSVGVSANGGQYGGGRLSKGRTTILGSNSNLFLGKNGGSKLGLGKAKTSSNSKGANGDLISDTDIELQSDGYNDELAYNGNQEFADKRGKLQAFDKNEAFRKDQGDGFTYDAAYSGTRVNDSISALRRSVVREEQDIEESFFNDYSKENHEGDYFGNEFDVGYKEKQVNGGFNDQSGKKKLEQNAFNNANKASDVYSDGKYHASENIGFNELDKEKRGRDTQIYSNGRNGGKGEGKGFSGFGDAEQDLYDKYTGKKVKPLDKEYVTQHGNKRTRFEDSQDEDKRFYGAEFNGKDRFGKKLDTEVNAGLKEEVELANQFNNGQYKDIEASGYNKGANYKGDYKTNKEKKDTGFRFRNNESIEEIGTPDRFATLIINDNTATFEGTERRSGNNDEVKFGKYTDQELNKKLDKDTHAKKFRGNEFDRELDEEKEVRAFYNANKDSGKKSDKYSEIEEYNPKNIYIPKRERSRKRERPF